MNQISRLGAIFVLTVFCLQIIQVKSFAEPLILPQVHQQEENTPTDQELAYKLSFVIQSYEADQVMTILKQNPSMNFGVRFFMSNEWTSPVETLVWVLKEKYEEIYLKKKPFGSESKRTQQELDQLIKIFYAFKERGADIDSTITMEIRDWAHESGLRVDQLNPETQFAFKAMRALSKKSNPFNSNTLAEKSAVKSCHFSELRDNIISTISQWTKEQQGHLSPSLPNQYDFESRVNPYCFLNFSITYEGRENWEGGRIPNLRISNSVTDLTEKEIATEIIHILKDPAGAAKSEK